MGVKKRAIFFRLSAYLSLSHLFISLSSLYYSLSLYRCSSHVSFMVCLFSVSLSLSHLTVIASFRFSLSLYPPFYLLCYLLLIRLTILSLSFYSLFVNCHCDIAVVVFFRTPILNFIAAIPLSCVLRASFISFVYATIAVLYLALRLLNSRHSFLLL